MTEREVHRAPVRFLPIELHDHLWYSLDDPTAVEEGEWIFDPASHAHYAGQIVHHDKDHGALEVRWYKSVDNVFCEWLSYNRIAGYRLWWADPMEQPQGVDPVQPIDMSNYH